MSPYFCFCPCLRAFLYLFPFISVYFFSLFLQLFFSLHIFPLLPLISFFFFSLFCHLFCVRHYLVSDARAFPGRPRRPAPYALGHASHNHYILPSFLSDNASLAFWAWFSRWFESLSRIWTETSHHCKITLAVLRYHFHVTLTSHDQGIK